MADRRPNNAPDEAKDRMAAGARAAAAANVPGGQPGGGGLGGASAAEGRATDTGGQSRNSPIDLPVPVDDATERAGAEAGLRAAGHDVAPEHPSST